MWWWRGAGTKAQESPNPGLASSRWARVQTLALRVGARYSQGQTRYREERQGVSASFQTKEMLQRPRGGKEMTEAAQMGNGVASLQWEEIEVCGSQGFTSHRVVGTAAAGVVEESAQLVSFVDQPALLERLLGRDAGRNITEDEVNAS